MSTGSLRPLAFVALAFSVASGGCGDDPLGPEATALASARARWEATGFTAYTYQYRLACFCPPQLLETARVSVSDGHVTAVYLIDSASPAPPETLGMYDTIDGLFDRLEADLARDPVLFDVTYDEDAGFPTSASVDISRQIADEEYSFTASTLIAVVP